MCGPYHRGNLRPLPPGFADAFVQLGWEAIEDHYQAGQTTIRRWMREMGEHELIVRRRGYMRKLYASRGRSSIMGRRCAVGCGGFPEMGQDDPALAWVPVYRGHRSWRGRLSAQFVLIDVEPPEPPSITSWASRYVMGPTLAPAR